MSVPAIAQMGKLTGDNKYFDEATKQVLSFADKMFNREKGVFMHGWVESMRPHPEFRWARANGWAFMALAELLEVLPKIIRTGQRYFSSIAIMLVAWRPTSQAAGFGTSFSIVLIRIWKHLLRRSTHSPTLAVSIADGSTGRRTDR